MIEISFKGQKHSVPEGTSMEDFLQSVGETGKCHGYGDNPVVAVLADGELLPLSAVKRHDFTLEPVRLFSEFGTYVYRDTMTFLLACAFNQVYPGRRIIKGHSLGDGYYCTVEGELGESLGQAAERLTAAMMELVRSDLRIEPVTLGYSQAVDHFRRMGCNHTVSIIEYRNNPEVECNRCGAFTDLSSGVLAPSTGTISLWEFRPYEDGFLLRYPRSFDHDRIREMVDNPLLFSIFREYRGWEKILGVSSVGDLNRVCYNGGIHDYIRLSEALQARKIASVADRIAEGGRKIVLIAGPSSSGKTTFAKKLCLELRMLGKNAYRMSLDDYYLLPDQIPFEADGEQDFEALEALDLDLIRHDLMTLANGGGVHLPSYSFMTHIRTFADEETVLGDNGVLVIEGIHGLNPNLCPQLDPAKTFRIFISDMAQLNIDDHTRISTTDSRLLRRIVRDNRARNTTCIETLRRWPSVLKGENTHIFPNQCNADIMFNSALDYELGVLSCYAVPLLKTVKPSEGPRYTKSRRLLKLLEDVYPIPAEHVPANSLLREFIGDGEFE